MNENNKKLTVSVSGKKLSLPLLLTLIIAAVLTLGFVLTSSPTFAVTAVFCLFVAFVGNFNDQKPDRRKDAPAVRIICMLIVVGILFTMPPLTITSTGIWQYPFQRAYVGIYQNVKEPDWFPDFSKDVESDYHFDYLPGIMQGTGHYSVEFVTSPERAAAYASRYAEEAQYTIPLRSIYSSSYRFPDSDKEINLYLSSDLWVGYWNSESNAQVYVLDAVMNPNHPHSSAIIIDTATGKIQLSELG